MGNCISDFLSELVMEDLEKSVLPNMPFTLPFYKRYVDDILLAIIPGKENEILEIFNKYDKNLKFTMELENEETKSINFLDMTLTRKEDGTIETTWYQKSVASGRYLNCKAMNPIGHKRNVVTGLVDRSITFSDPTNRPQSLKHVRELMRKSGYPTSFTEKIIKERVDKFYNNNNHVTQSNPIKRYISAPYVPGLSDQLKKTLRKHEFGLSCRANNTIGKLFTKCSEQERHRPDKPPATILKCVPQTPEHPMMTTLIDVDTVI